MCPLRLNSCFLSPGPSGLNKDYLPVDVSLLIGKGPLGENPETRPQLWHLSTSHRYRLSQMPVGSPRSVSCVPPDIQMIRQGQEDTLWASWSYDYVFYPPNTIEIDFNLTLKTSSWQPIEQYASEYRDERRTILRRLLLLSWVPRATASTLSAVGVGNNATSNLISRMHVLNTMSH